MDILRKFWLAGIKLVRYPVPFYWLVASAVMVCFKETPTGIHENGLGFHVITKNPCLKSFYTVGCVSVIFRRFSRFFVIHLE